VDAGPAAWLVRAAALVSATAVEHAKRSLKKVDIMGLG